MARNPEITPESGYIFRITHIDNVPWIARHGLCCASHPTQHVQFTPIGNAGIIGRRAARPVTCGPTGVLSDYVPFYFTPHSPMFYNIITGRGVTKRPTSEIALIVSRIPVLTEHGVDYVIADRNASLNGALFGEEVAHFPHLPWSAWQNRDFRINAEAPDRFEHYQAEVLAYWHVPPAAIRSITCVDRATEERLRTMTNDIQHCPPIHVYPGWFF